MEEQYARIKTYALKLKNIEDTNLLEFCIEIAVDRVLLYLNKETLDTKFERLVADLVATTFASYESANEKVVTSMSDNGQSISYANEVRNYFTSTTDKEFLGSTINLLSRYRRVSVGGK